MEGIIEFVTENARHAPWVVFSASLLAGMNIPISIDILLALSAVLAATTIPEYTYLLFGSVLIGCIFAAWISYWVGRLAGTSLKKIRLFRKPLSDENIAKVRSFYERYGFWTQVVGRFIPFGVRNCLFMSSGMSRLPFKRFALRDAIACTIWAAVFFPIYYTIGSNIDMLASIIKKFNLIVFGLFGLTGIGIFWYKRRKKRPS